MSALECKADLPERQRRARFSSSEQRALAAHYDGCSACRTGRQLLADFAELDTVDARDCTRIQRIAALARGRVAGSAFAPLALTAKRRLIRTLGLAAAVLLLVGSALASMRLWRAKVEPKPLATGGVRVAPSPARATALPSAASAVELSRARSAR